MNIFQKFEAELDYPASYDVHQAKFDLMGGQAVRESASLLNWLWDNYSVWVRINHEINAFSWYIDLPSIKRHTNGKVFKTPQQAYISAFEAVLTALTNHSIK
jgi:hypothetical protein